MSVFKRQRLFVSDGREEARRSFQGASFVALDMLSSTQIGLVLETAARMQEMTAERGYAETLKGKIVACVFYEPSTRTNCSFQAAMMRLGGNVIAVNESCSSSQKGETLSDTVRCLECYCDAIVLRHPRAGAAAEAADALRKPLLNAGDGVGEHPSQALLDLFTIVNELELDGVPAETLKGKVVTMVGDLKNGRTVHSLSKLLGRFGVKLNYVSPSVLRMPSDIIEMASKNGATYVEHDQLSDEILAETDILYVTRVQKERFNTIEDYDRVKDAFIITKNTMAKMKLTARVLHPLPRVGEIDVECDNDPRAAYFRQMENGMYVRMALLELILGTNE